MIPRWFCHSIIASASIVFITDMSNSKNWGGVLAISIAIVGNTLSNMQLENCLSYSKLPLQQQYQQCQKGNSNSSFNTIAHVWSVFFLPLGILTITFSRGCWHTKVQGFYCFPTFSWIVVIVLMCLYVKFMRYFRQQE